MKLLRDAITEIGTAPCEQCPHADRCRTEVLACSMYAHWANGSRPSRARNAKREPSREIYDRTFAGGGA